MPRISTIERTGEDFWSDCHRSFLDAKSETNAAEVFPRAIYFSLNYSKIETTLALWAISKMPTLYNVQLWLEHAATTRALSTDITDPQTKQQMLNVAAGFDRIAGLAMQLRSTSNFGYQSERRHGSWLWTISA